MNKQAKHPSENISSTTKTIAIEITKATDNHTIEKQIQSGDAPAMPTQTITLEITADSLNRPIPLENGASIQINSDGTFYFHDNGAYNSLPLGSSVVTLFEIHLTSSDKNVLAINLELEPDGLSEGSSDALAVEYPGAPLNVDSVPRDLSINFGSEFLTLSYTPTPPPTLVQQQTKLDSQPVTSLIALDPVYEQGLNNSSSSAGIVSLVLDSADYPTVVSTNIFAGGSSFGPDGAGSFGLLPFTRQGVTIDDITANQSTIGFTDPGGISHYYPAPFQQQSSFYQEPNGAFQQITTPEGNTLTLYLTDYMGHQAGDLVYVLLNNVPHIPDLPGLNVFDTTLQLHYNGTNITIDAQVFLDPFMYYIQDADGDVSTNFIQVHVVDDIPTAASHTASINEADIMTIGSNAEAVPATVSGFLIDGFTTNLGADDGIVSNVTIEGGTTVIDPESNLITVTTQEGNILEVNQTTGRYTYYLNHPIDNDSSQHANNLTASDQFQFELTDFDFDQAESTLTITIVDDVPVVSINSLSGSLAVDETNFSVNASANLASLFTVSPGADGVQNITYHLTLNDTQVNSGLIDTLTQQAVVMTMVNGDIIGSFIGGSAAGGEVFRISINSATGEVTLNQSRAIEHANPNNANDVVSLENNLIAITATVIDKDGDSATASNQIGSLMQFYDDGPTIQTNAISGISLQVDESNFNTDSHANLSSAFLYDAGSDGAKSIDYHLTINNANSGLVDSITNEAITMSMVNGNIIGSSATGGEVFRISINSATGEVTLNQSRAIVHANSNDPNDVVSLANNLIAIAATVIDNDGDSATASNQIGSLIQFYDDGPTIQTNGVSGITLLADESTLNTESHADFSNAFSYDTGNDDAKSLDYQLIINNANSGLVDSVTQEAITMSFDANGNIVGSSVNGGESFRISVDSSTGIVTLEQSRSIDTNVSDDLASIINGSVSLQLTVTDNDLDTAAASVVLNNVISFQNDVPVANPDTLTLNVSETSYHLTFILDVSGSMISEVAPGRTRLELLQDALIGTATQTGLLDAYAANSANLSISIITFESGASGPFQFNNIDDAKSYIAGLTPTTGDTYLDEAIATALPIISDNDNSTIDRVYLLSDGVPTPGHEVTDPLLSNWQSTLSTEDVDAIMLNISGTNATPIAINLGALANPSDDPKVIDVAADLSNLSTLLNATIDKSEVTGNLLDNDTLSAGLPNHISQISFIDTNGNTVTLDIPISSNVEFTTSLGNTLNIHSDGSYAYTYIHANTTTIESEQFTYTLQDSDLDSSSTTFTINLIPPGSLVMPVVFDLNGDGQIELTSSAQSSVAWNVTSENGSSSTIKTGWVGADDGILVYDQNNNGNVDGLNEIELSKYNPNAVTDIEGLKLAFDSNHDSLFNQQDEKFNQFLIWNDKNQDGISDSNELFSLHDAGVISIDLSQIGQSEIVNGNMVFGSVSVATTDGKTMQAADVGLQITSVTPSSPIIVSEVIETSNNLEEVLTNSTQASNSASNQADYKTSYHAPVQQEMIQEQQVQNEGGIM